jgi:hypothetical protein
MRRRCSPACGPTIPTFTTAASPRFITLGPGQRAARIFG